MCLSYQNNGVSALCCFSLSYSTLFSPLRILLLPFSLLQQFVSSCHRLHTSTLIYPTKIISTKMSVLK